MRFAPPEENISLYETGFNGDDLLGRKKVGERLSAIIERIEDPLVIALDGRWGTGKSYFLKRWVGAHKLENEGTARTVYFDAFAHDYLSDPLIALIGSISEQNDGPERSKLDRVKSAAFKLLKPASRIGLAVATYGATTALSEVGDVFADATRDEVQKSLETFWAREEGRQSAMEEFRNAIEALTNPADTENTDEESTPTPLVFVVDELDRCRPDYALEVLEIMKHFFSVPHVHFVLGVNLKALENSVKARYGSEIDAAAYLKKFLSFSMSFPDHIDDGAKTPALRKYVDFLEEEMGTPKHLSDQVREQIDLISKSQKISAKISIRDVGKIMSAISLLPDNARDENLFPGWPIIMISLVITRVIDPDFFQDLCETSVDVASLYEFYGLSDDKIARSLPDGNHNVSYHHAGWMIGMAWMFVLKDGDMSDLPNTIRDDQNIGKFFYRFGDGREPNRIPRQIVEDFLNDFKLS